MSQRVHSYTVCFSVGCRAEVWSPTFSGYIWLIEAEETNPSRMLAAQHAVKIQTCVGALCMGNSSNLSIQALPSIHCILPLSFFFFLRGTLVLIPPRQCQATSCVCSSEHGSALKHCGRWLQDSLVTKDKHGGEALARAPERSQSAVKRKANWTQRWTRGCSRFIVFPWKCCFRFA